MRAGTTTDADLTQIWRRIALSMANVFRFPHTRAKEIVAEVAYVGMSRRSVANHHGLTHAAQDRMQRGVRLAPRWTDG